MNINTPIAADLMNKLSTRARNILIEEKMLTCEQLMRCSEKDFFNIVGVGKKTIKTLGGYRRRLQNGIPLLTSLIKTPRPNIQWVMIVRLSSIRPRTLTV